LNALGSFVPKRGVNLKTTPCFLLPETLAILF
jgi:hypothetical protein